MGPALRASIVGSFFNTVLPARAGEAARVLALTTGSEDVAGRRRRPTIVVERAYDVLSLLVLLFVAVPWLPQVTLAPQRRPSSRSRSRPRSSVVIAVTLAVFGSRPLHWMLRPLGRLPFATRERLEAIGESSAAASPACATAARRSARSSGR